MKSIFTNMVKEKVYVLTWSGDHILKIFKTKEKMKTFVKEHFPKAEYVDRGNPNGLYWEYDNIDDQTDEGWLEGLEIELI